MKNPWLLCLLLSLRLSTGLAAFALTEPPFAKWTSSGLLLNNGIVQRTIKLPAPGGSFLTTAYKPVVGDFGYFGQTNPDFSFTVDDSVYTGTGQWQIQTIQPLRDTHQGDGAAVTLRSADGKIELTLHYLLYPSLPVVRKRLLVKNLTNRPIRLESVDTEKFESGGYVPTTFSWICHDYGRRRSIGPYEGDRQDALITVHNMDTRQGIVIGNEAAGIMKRTAVFWNSTDICAGLTHKNARFPFRKWIQPGQSFETPFVFTMVYNTYKDPDEILNTAVPEFTRKHMGIRLSELAEKPTFVYNTWNPFKSNIMSGLSGNWPWPLPKRG